MPPQVAHLSKLARAPCVHRPLTPAAPEVGQCRLQPTELATHCTPAVWRGIAFYPVMIDGIAAGGQSLACEILISYTTTAVIHTYATAVAEKAIHDEVLTDAAITCATKDVCDRPTVALGDVPRWHLIDGRFLEAPPYEEDYEE